MFNNLIGKNKELGRFLFCERYTLPPVKNAMYIAEGQELKRGAVVDVNGVLVGTNSLMPYAVLEFDCDTRSGGKETSVFVKGEFNFDKLTFASGLSTSDMDNIVYNGNLAGLIIKPYVYEKTFTPISDGGRKTYTDKIIGYLQSPYTIDVAQKDSIFVNNTNAYNAQLKINLAENCDDAILSFQFPSDKFSTISVKRGEILIYMYDLKNIVNVFTDNESVGDKVVVTDVSFNRAIDSNQYFAIEIKGECAIFHTI